MCTKTIKISAVQWPNGYVNRNPVVSYRVHTCIMLHSIMKNELKSHFWLILGTYYGKPEFQVNPKIQIPGTYPLCQYNAAAGCHIAALQKQDEQQKNIVMQTASVSKRLLRYVATSLGMNTKIPNFEH